VRNVCSEQIAFLVNILNHDAKFNERDNAVVPERSCLMNRMHGRTDCKQAHQAESNKQ
jgi:hypothetical protein